MRHRRSGLTLMELLVVLTILAVLTTIAMTTTESVIDQARFDATEATLRNIEEAIVGPAQQSEADGTLSVSGFVSDVGRLPALEELVVNPNGLAPYGPKGAPAEDSEILLVYGWRGPYLRLPSGIALPSDGWGRTINYALPTQTTPLTFFSYGADGLAGGTGFAADRIPVTIPPHRYSGSVSSHIFLKDAAGQPRTTTEPIIVRLYAPGGSVPATVTSEGAGVYHYSVPTTIGRRVLRAYEGAVRKSRIAPLVIPSGGAAVDLTIQAAS